MLGSLEEEREAILDELRPFGFKSDFLAMICQSENQGEKIADSDIYLLLRLLLAFVPLNCAYCFIFKLTIDELRIPAGIYLKVKIGGASSFNKHMYSNNLKDSLHAINQVAVVLVEICKEKDQQTREFLLAFGAASGNQLTSESTKITLEYNQSKPQQEFSREHLGAGPSSIEKLSSDSPKKSEITSIGVG